MAKGEIEIEQKFADFIKFKRKQLGLSQEDLGDLIFGDIKYKKQKISKIENKKSNPTLATVQKFLEVFNCDIDFIDLENQ